jgi:hypothetical protein
MAVTEKEAYGILSKPYVRVAEVGQLLGYTNKVASRLLREREVRKVHRGCYVTADFRKKFDLEAYWKQVSRYADK